MNIYRGPYSVNIYSMPYALGEARLKHVHIGRSAIIQLGYVNTLITVWSLLVQRCMTALYCTIIVP